MNFTKIFQLKGLKPKNNGQMNFYECCDLTEKVYLVWCRQMSYNCPFFSFLARPHSRWGVIIKVLRTTERHCYIPHWQNGCSTVQHRSALLSERFNSMRCFFTEWGDQMALFPPLTNPNPRITIYQMCLFHDNTGPFSWHEEMNPNQIG